MSNDKWLEEIDQASAVDEKRLDILQQRDLNDLERRRIDYLSKLAQQQAAEVDLLIAESYAAHDKPQGALRESDLDPDEQAAISRARNGLELSNARLKVLINRCRYDCNMPFHARLRGFEWYDESSGKPVKIVRSKD